MKCLPIERELDLKGVQRGIVQQVLDEHPLIEEFWDDTDSHLGATIARIRAATNP